MRYTFQFSVFTGLPDLGPWHAIMTCLAVPPLLPATGRTGGQARRAEAGTARWDLSILGCVRGYGQQPHAIGQHQEAVRPAYQHIWAEFAVTREHHGHGAHEHSQADQGQEACQQKRPSRRRPGFIAAGQAPIDEQSGNGGDIK
jgi:hypothetical protein